MIVMESGTSSIFCLQVAQSKDAVELGTSALVEAKVFKKRTNRLMFFALICVIAILIVIAVVIVLAIRPWK